MSDLTPASVAKGLSQIGKDLEGKAVEIASLDEAHVRLRAAYKVQFAREFMGADGAMDIRRYTAELATADALLEAELAEQVLRASRTALQVLRDRLDIGRSLNSVLKMEWGGQ